MGDGTGTLGRHLFFLEGQAGRKEHGRKRKVECSGLMQRGGGGNA